MEYFAGLDVSLEETAICIIDDNGLIVREHVSRVSRKRWLPSFGHPEWP